MLSLRRFFASAPGGRLRKMLLYSQARARARSLGLQSAREWITLRNRPPGVPAHHIVNMVRSSPGWRIFSDINHDDWLRPNMTWKQSRSLSGISQFGISGSTISPPAWRMNLKLSRSLVVLLSRHYSDPADQMVCGLQCISVLRVGVVRRTRVSRYEPVVEERAFAE